MSTPSSGDGRPPAPEPTASRDLRDTLWFKLAALGAVLVAAFVVMRSCGREDRIGQDEAVAIAREQVPFEPDDYQVRYVQRGIPPVGYWAVSLYTTTAAGTPRRVRVVLVNATTGEVTRALGRLGSV